MKEPLFIRKNIPFYIDKSPAAMRADPYESYDPLVIRQSAICIMDEWWEGFPYSAVKEWINNFVGKEDAESVLELGCGVGRLIGDIAISFPNSNCWGIDYSYQMLRQAYRLYKSDEDVEINFTKKGKRISKVSGKKIPNLHFGLAKAEELPFEDQQFDIVFSSFLVDRVEDPILVLQESIRVLKPSGKLLIVTPLNFNKASHWDDYYPVEKFASKVVGSVDLKMIELNQEIKVIEPLDIHGNYLHWNCVAMAFTHI